MHMMEKQKIENKSILCMAFCLGICMIMSMVSLAAQQYGSIKIKAMIQKDEEITQPLAQVPFTLYRVGVRKAGKWELTKAFSGSHEDLNKIDPLQQKKLAAQLCAYAKQHNLTGITHSSDAQGEVLFAQQEEGMYVVAQQKMVSIEGDVYQSMPFILSLPQQLTKEVLWEVEVEPKFENIALPVVDDGQEVPKEPVKKEEDNTVDTAIPLLQDVQTGDVSRAGWFVCACAGSAILASLLWGKKGKKEHTDKS